MLDERVASQVWPFSARAVEVRRVAVWESQSVVWEVVRWGGGGRRCGVEVGGLEERVELRERERRAWLERVVGRRVREEERLRIEGVVGRDFGAR